MAMAATVAISGELDEDVQCEGKKKGSRKISAPPWLKNRLVGGKPKVKKHKPVPCCGVEVTGENDTATVVKLEERQFQDKSVQCDDFFSDTENRFSNHSNRCASCCHPMNPIYQTNLIVNQIPFMDEEPDEIALSTFRRSHNPIRHRRNSRVNNTPAPTQALFRKNNLFPQGALNETPEDAPVQRWTVHGSNGSQNWTRPSEQSDVAIPNSIAYPSPTIGILEKPREHMRRRNGTFGNVAFNVQIINANNTSIMEKDERDTQVVPNRRHGVVQTRFAVRESPEESSRSSCLVLDMNGNARSPLNYKMYTPFYNKRQSMPPEHFKNWPSESKYDAEQKHNHRKSSYHSEKANLLEHNERKGLSVNVMDSNSTWYRSVDGLSQLRHRTGSFSYEQPEDLIPNRFGDKETNTRKFQNISLSNRRNELSLQSKNIQSRPKQKQVAEFTTPNLLAPSTSVFGRWSGSIQNLFSSRNTASDSASGQWSKSENCLNEVGQQEQQRQRLRPSAKTSERPLWLFGRSTVKNERSRRNNTFLTSGGGSFFTYKYDDEEESTWQKYLGLNMLRKRRKPEVKPNGRTKRIQDLDGSFFEKFGSLLRAKSNQYDESVQAKLEPFPDESTELPPSGETDDSGTETLLDESDSEEQQEKQTEFIEDVFGWNVEELYEEILFENIYNVGCEDEELTVEDLFPYIQEAFKISDEKHNEILDIARSKKAPEIRLNVEIVEAKDLEPKDSDGLSDPFVTMYIASNPDHRYNTSVKTKTLNPVWEEHFSLPITENTNDANLIVEVWDFDPAETVKEKMNKLFEVKGVRGMRKLMKEIAQTVSTGKHDNELIGHTSIPLKSIPATGLLMWYNLDKKNKLRRQGTLRIRLNFSSQKNSHVAAQEHRHLLRILLLHELESSQVAPYWWSGKFTLQGEAVLTQHSAQSSLSSTTEAFIQWSVFSAIHQDHPLSFGLFDTLLDKLIRPVQTRSISEDELKSFWDGAKKLLPSCFSVIRKLRKKMNSDKMVLKTLGGVLNILNKISMLEPPEETDLFPVAMYSWIQQSNDNEPPNDIREVLTSAVVLGAEDFYKGIKKEHYLRSGSDEDRMQNLIQIVQLVRSDIQKSIEFYDKTFIKIMNVSYAKELYITYERKLTEIVKPTVEDVCRSLKNINTSKTAFSQSNESNFIAYEEMNMGTTLFELYIVLKNFSALGSSISPEESSFSIHEYHHWFTAAVTHWLDIAADKARTRIQKAIDLDKLVPNDEMVKHSSSAVDTVQIFYQIQIFWQQLAWPDVEESYAFVTKIVTDICRCCIFYADCISARVENLMLHVNEDKFAVTPKWCLAIYNIEYIQERLSFVVSALGVDDILANLSVVRGSNEAERCKETLRAVLDNAIDTETQIQDLLEKLARKMGPTMRRFLFEGAELLQQDTNSLEGLMMYMEESLSMLNAELSEINFDRMLDAIWAELTTILNDLLQSSLNKRRPPAFFANLRKTVDFMVANFNNSDTSNDTLTNIKRLLELHAYETTDLIHQYYLYKLEEQNNTEPSAENYGMLTVRCFFNDTELEIEIMNARNLKPMDGNGSCDPFVRVYFLPEEKFTSAVKPKTQSHNKTLFPLFDEKFTITLTSEQRSTPDAMIMFTLKDKEFLGMSNQYIAECYLSFNDIADISSDTGKIEQKHLVLTRPYRTDIDYLRVLEYRQGDKQAKEFLKKLKQKMSQ